MDQTLISTVKNTVSHSGHSSYLVAQVKRSEGKLSSTDIISINNRSLMTLNQKGNKITNTFSWLNLTSIKYSKPKLKFYFQKTKYSIIISDEKVVKTVSEALQKILLSRELKSIGWTELNQPSLPNSPLSAMNRILERAHLEKEKIPTETIEKIFSVLIYSQPELYINEIPNIITYIDIFFESLPLFSDLYNIAISKAEKFDPYTVLKKYVSVLKELRRFEIAGPRTESFPDFFQAFAKHQHNHLFSVAFRNTCLEEKDLNSIHDFIIGRNIKGVEFHKAIKNESLPALFQFFFDKDLLANLRSLNISESVEININHLIPKLNNIQILSLAKCEVEIGITLKNLSSLTNLKMLDLSNNPSRVKITTMPPNLTSLYLNYVSWSDQTLFYFISHLPNHYMTISMCHAQASQGEWTAFYNYLPTLHENLGIESFAFDGNRIHPNLFSFLSENNRLYYLSLNGCFAENDSESISALCKFVLSSRSLESLIVRGGKNLFLGRNVESVISAVLNSKNVSYLDISDNRSGDFAFNQLRQILTLKNNLETLVFDGLTPNNADSYIDFIKCAINKKSLEMSFPLYDLMYLVNQKKITAEKVYEIKNLFTARNETGVIFKKYPNYNAFPLYLRKDKFSQLSEPVEIIQNRPRAQTQKPQKVQQKKQPNKNQQKQPKQQKQIQQQQQQVEQKQFQPIQLKNPQQQQQQLQQQQIQQLQQQLQIQQLQQQQLQQQLQQQIQNQQKQVTNNNNFSASNSKKKLPQLNIKDNQRSPQNKNISGPEPTLIVDDNDEYDPNDPYQTYDDEYNSEIISNHRNRIAKPNNKSNRQYNDDYDYDYDELDYSPIEYLKRPKLPARPQSATRYRSDMNNNRPNTNGNVRQTPNNNRPQSARKQPPRRTQSVRRSTDLRETTNVKKTIGARNANSGRTSRNNRRPNSSRPTRSASACQMRKDQRIDEYDSFINDIQKQDDFSYYSPIYADDDQNHHKQNKRPTKTRQRRRRIRNPNNQNKKNKSLDDYDYNNDKDDFNQNRPSTKRNKPTESAIDYEYSFEYKEEKQRNNNKLQNQRNKNNDAYDYYSSDGEVILRNKPKPALRNKPKNKKKESSTSVAPPSKKSPKKSELTKPALKEFQKQNKMKLRQAQLRQQIQLLEEEEENEANKSASQSFVTKETIFNDDVSNLETTYDIPSWNFPIKMKFEFDDQRTFKIEKNFATATFIEEILKPNTPKVSKVIRKSASLK